MNNTPAKIKADIARIPWYRKCCRSHHGGCSGRITLEHSLIYRGRQIQEVFSIIPLCEYHHAVCKHMDGGDLNKRYNHWVAISRMTDDDKRRYDRFNWDRELKNLEKEFGTPENKIILDKSNERE